MVKSKLIFGDFRVHSDKVDVVIDMINTDLPYEKTAHKNDVMIPFEDIWGFVEKVSKNNAAKCFYAQGLFYVDLVQSNRKKFRYDLCWDKILKSGHLNSKRMPMRQHEQVAVFYNKLPTYNPQKVLGKPNNSKGTKHLEQNHRNENYGNYKSVETPKSEWKHPGSIIRFQKPHPSVANHRTEKSIEANEWLIRTYTNEGEWVLDMTCGSCSVGRACLNINRNFIAFENDWEVYFKAMGLIKAHPKFDGQVEFIY